MGLGKLPLPAGKLRVRPIVSHSTCSGASSCSFRGWWPGTVRRSAPGRYPQAGLLLIEAIGSGRANPGHRRDDDPRPRPARTPRVAYLGRDRRPAAVALVRQRRLGRQASLGEALPPWKARQQDDQTAQTSCRADFSLPANTYSITPSNADHNIRARTEMRESSKFQTVFTLITLNYSHQSPG
jgi:hypothetical protein